MSAPVMRTVGARELPIDLLLSSIPSLPRHVLDRLVERAIDYMDALDAASEDLEDDDPAGGNVEDTGESASFVEWTGEGAQREAFADDELEEDLDDRRIRKPHMQRIQRTRCNRIIDRWGYVTHRLRSDS